MKPNQSNGKWWLAAVLLPVLAVGIGFLGAATAPFNQNDWLGLRFVFPIFAGLFIGCLLCCVTAVISVLRKEQASGVAIFLAVPSLIFIIYVGVLAVHGRQAALQQKASEMIRGKKEKEQMDQIYSWRDKFRANPSLITNDVFWNAQTNRERLAERGLVELIRDQSFKFSPEINDYISKKLPGGTEALLLDRHFSREELISMAKDPQNSRRIRESALGQLVRDKNFDVTDEWKTYVIDQFPNELGDLLLDERFTKNELETLLQNPKVSDEAKHVIKEDLEIGRYKN